MTTQEKLQQRFDGKDIGALMEMLEIWKTDPDRLLSVFVAGMNALSDEDVLSGLRRFSANFTAAAETLEGTEDGTNFNHLRAIVDSYLEFLDFEEEKAEPLLN